MIRLLLIALLLIPCIHAQLPAGTASAIDRIVARALADSGTPAVSIAIVREGKLAFANAYGDARLEPKTPAESGMRFGIGSVSKQFLAVALLLAQESGQLSLDDKVSRYLPGLTRASEVTVRQLLSHTAGYQDYYPQDYPPPFMREPVTPAGILDRWASKPLDFEPGSAWQYSNTGYVAAGQVLEKATGTGVTAFFRQRIFEPLGMKSVIDLDRQPLTRSDAAGYVRDAIGPLHPAVPEASGWLYAAGALAMTASDLARWDTALIEGKLLSRRSFDQLITPARLTTGAPQSYALGVSVTNFRGYPKLSHDGAISGFASGNTVWPASKTAVVVLANKDGSSAPGRITRELESLLLTPGADPDAARLLDQAKKIYSELLETRLDRTQFTANGNAYFTPEVIAGYAASLKPLGPPKSFDLLNSSLRGGLTTRQYRLVFTGKTLILVTRAEPGGKLEQYIISE